MLNPNWGYFDTPFFLRIFKVTPILGFIFYFEKGKERHFEK